MNKTQLHLLNTVVSWLIAVSAVIAVARLAYLGKPWDEIVFRLLQFIVMLVIMQLPRLLRSRFSIEVPWLLSIVIVIFCFSALIMGDGMDFYGRLPWWDKLLHAESGVLLSMIALWLIHVIMADNDKYIYFNKWFLCLFLIMFSVGLGACWEIMEFSYDSIMGTNTQQFMATTTGSIFTPEDEPLCGHAALCDSMQDLILDLAGALLVAVYGLIYHDKLIERYKQILNEN
jgi:hypothetical protein